MQTIKATIKFIDTKGGIYLLSEHEGGILLRGLHMLNGYEVGDEVTLFRDYGGEDRRVNDRRKSSGWQIEAGGR